MSPRARKPPQTSTATTPPGASRETAAATMAPESRMNRISQRAYEIYERRGGQGGHEMEDWLQAEREIDNER